MAESVEIIDTLSPALARLASGGADFTKPMQEIAGKLEMATGANFLKQASPQGVPWAKRKVVPGQKDFGHPILRRTGDLFGSIGRSFGPDFAMAGPEASAGAGVYAAIHQFGGTIKPKKAKAMNTPFGVFASVTMPARPYAGWNDALRNMARDVCAEHIQSLINAAASDGKNGGSA